MRPFRDNDSFKFCSHVLSSVKNEIEVLENGYILKSSKTEIENYFLNMAHIEPIEIDEQYYISDTKGIRLDVSHDFMRAVFPGEKLFVAGTDLDISMGYSGDVVLWQIRPSSFSLGGYPDLNVKKNEITFTISFPDDNVNPEQIKREIDSYVRSLIDAAKSLKRDIDNHNRTAPEQVKSFLQRKYQKANQATNAIEKLGIPIKRCDSPRTYTVPTLRRASPVTQLPRSSVDKYEPEPALDIKEYDHIIDIMKSMSLVIERSPTAFQQLEEEAIRTHFLIQLNGHYEGTATGETFNASGKTDILIRIENKNVFIAECKFWHGEKVYNEAIDQILSYLSWRDSKCALIVFNKNKSSTAVRDKMHEIMTERRECRRTVFINREGISRYILVKDSDPGKEIVVSSLLFDIPCV